MSSSVLPMFYFKSFIVSGLTFRSLIHFEFIFVYGVRKCSNFILLHVSVQFSQHYLLKRLSLPHCIFLPPLSIIRYPQVHGFISGLPILFHWSIFLFLCQYHTVLMTVALSQLFTLLFHFHQEALQFFTFCHKGCVICISEVINISPSNLHSNLCFVVLINLSARQQWSCRHRGWICAQKVGRRRWEDLREYH